MLNRKGSALHKFHAIFHQLPIFSIYILYTLRMHTDFVICTEKVAKGQMCMFGESVSVVVEQTHFTQ